MLQRLVLDDARDADQMPARVVMFRGDGVCMLSLSTHQAIKRIFNALKINILIAKIEKWSKTKLRNDDDKIIYSLSISIY